MSAGLPLSPSPGLPSPLFYQQLLLLLSGVELVPFFSAFPSFIAAHFPVPVSLHLRIL